MSWGRMDDKFHRNRKVRKLRRTKAGRDALGTWVWWWSWCLDDPEHSGIVPSEELQADEKRSAELLVSAGLWEPIEDGFKFHDYHTYNPSKEQRETKRVADRDRQREHRAKSKADTEPGGNILAGNDGVSQRDNSDGHTLHPDESHATPKSVASPARGPYPTRTQSRTQPVPNPSLTDGAGVKTPTLSQQQSKAVWLAYSAAYSARYASQPVRNAKVNGQLKQFISRVPAGEAPDIAAHYVDSQQARYIAAGHPIGMLLQDAEKLRTEWRTGKRTTSHIARQADKQEGRGQEYDEVLKRLGEIKG